MDRLHASGGTITVRVNDRTQRNLVLTLEKMTDANTVTRVLVDGPLVTYRLREHQSVDRPDAEEVPASSDPKPAQA